MPVIGTSMMPCGTCWQCPCQCAAPRYYPTYTTGTLSITSQRLSDEDVERIAKRVADLLRDEMKAFKRVTRTTAAPVTFPDEDE